MGTADAEVAEGTERTRRTALGSGLAGHSSGSIALRRTPRGNSKRENCREMQTRTAEGLLSAAGIETIRRDPFRGERSLFLGTALSLGVLPRRAGLRGRSSSPNTHKALSRSGSGAERGEQPSVEAPRQFSLAFLGSSPSCCFSGARLSGGDPI